MGCAFLLDSATSPPLLFSPFFLVVFLKVLPLSYPSFFTKKSVCSRHAGSGQHRLSQPLLRVRPDPYVPIDLSLSFSAVEAPSMTLQRSPATVSYWPACAVSPCRQPLWACGRTFLAPCKLLPANVLLSLPPSRSFLFRGHIETSPFPFASSTPFFSSSPFSSSSCESFLFFIDFPPSFFFFSTLCFF